MERMTGGRIGNTGRDNLIAKLYPQPDSFLVELKTPGTYERGAVLSLESDGSYEVLGAGSGKASCVLADPTLETDKTAVAYRSGHLNRGALIVKDGYTMTAADENDLRLAGIFLSDMLDAAGEAESADENREADNDLDKIYTADELNAMTIDRIKKLAAERGYTITKTVKADIVSEFLTAQGE